MHVEFSPDGHSQINKFSKLGVWYVLALSAIASIAIAGQVLIQQHLSSQVSDSRVVNLAGSQRYKSQVIVKMSMLIYSDIDHTYFSDKTRSLEEVLDQWKKGHRGLQFGDGNLKLPGHNSAKINAMFADIDPYFQRVYESARNIIRYKSGTTQNADSLKTSLRVLLDNESIFLSKMDRIVFQFDQEARQKVAFLSRLEYILLAISIAVIGLEIVFIFRPTTIQVNRTITQLMASEKNAKTLSKEIGALYASLEKTYEELSIVNQPVENPRLLAKTDKGGTVKFISDNFSKLNGFAEPTQNLQLSALFPGMSNPDDWMDEVIDEVSDGNTWQGEIRFTDPHGGDRWVHAVITPVFNEADEVDELVMMGADITKRKEAEQNMSVKNRAEIEKKINQQKFRSVLILEGQEEERKRIAMDIHDGIGQMLTSLKFQIESIDLKDRDKASEKMKEIDMLIKEVIREVRKVTFNLKPTVLGDFGMHAALNNFVQEIGKLTDTKLVFNSSGPIERLPQKTENNIFRIVQEAINNAIKYSQASTIQVELHQLPNELIISVRDDGKGFESDIVESRNLNIESGRGFFNMYERTEYINGKLSIDSEPGKGTVVTLSVPYQTTIAIE